MSGKQEDVAHRPAQDGPSLGRPRLHLRRTDSTNARAHALALAGAPHGTLVTAEFQTAGRGRHGRSWSAPPRSSLLASVIVRSPPPLLALVAAVAVCDVAPEEAMIKWPNDVVIARTATAAGHGAALAKLAGILIEGRPQEGWAVVGIGLNVAVSLDDLPPELHATAATLDGSPQDVEPTLVRLLVALARRLAEPAEETLLAWRARDALLGREICWIPAAGADQARGRAAGVDGAGRLIVTLEGGGRLALDAGEVHLLDDA